MRFQFTIDVEVQRTEGKFATRDEIDEAIVAELEQTQPSLDGLGPDGTTEYEIIDWSVTSNGKP